MCLLNPITVSPHWRKNIHGCRWKKKFGLQDIWDIWKGHGFSWFKKKTFLVKHLGLISLAKPNNLKTVWSMYLNIKASRMFFFLPMKGNEMLQGGKKKPDNLKYSCSRNLVSFKKKKDSGVEMASRMHRCIVALYTAVMLRANVFWFSQRERYTFIFLLRTSCMAERCIPVLFRMIESAIPCLVKLNSHSCCFLLKWTW